MQLATNDDFRKYVFRVARNTAISYLRLKEVRREQPFPKTEDGSTLEPPDRSPCPDESFKLERIKALGDCMRKLDQEKKHTIFLWEVLAGKDYQAIAEQFKVSMNTVGSTLPAGRKNKEPASTQSQTQRGRKMSPDSHRCHQISGKKA